MAIQNANDSPGADVITIGGPITLTGTLPTIETDLEIKGGEHTISADGNSGLLIDGEWTVTIGDLEIRDADGDGIASRDADVTLNGVTVVGSGDDGFQLEGGSVSITGSGFVDNGGDGATIETDTGPVTINGSHFDANDRSGLLVDAHDATQVNVSLSGAEDNEDPGFVFVGGEVAGFTLADLTSVDNVAGILVELTDAATAEGSGSTGDLNEFEGFVFLTSGTAWIEFSDSSASENGGSGALIDADEGSRVDLVRVDAVGNAANGYAIEAGPSASVSIVESASTANGGAGLEADPLTGDSELVVERSTLSGNAETGARVRLVDDTAFVVRNSTVSGNGAAGRCVAGIEVISELESQDGAQGGTFELRHSTVWANVGVENCPQVGVSFVETVLVSHSIIAGTGWDLADSGEPSATVEWSILGTFDPEQSSPILAAAVADPSNTIGDPALAPLADNGGPTWTHLLLPESPALDGGDPAIEDAPETDQRGSARIAREAIDIGAVEMPADETEPAGLPETGADSAGLAGAAVLLLLVGVGALGARRVRRA